jgi:hypothetical protein
MADGGWLIADGYGLWADDVGLQHLVPPQHSIEEDLLTAESLIDQERFWIHDTFWHNCRRMLAAL